MKERISGFALGAKLPLVLQDEAAECGLACLAMVSTYFRRKMDLVTLRREHGVSLKGTSLQNLMDIASHLNLSSRAVRLDLDELGSLCTPAILHWDLNHFVVLHGVSRKTVTIYDPAVGVRTLSLSGVSRHFTGVALELVPAPGFVRGDDRKRLHLGDLLKATRGLKRFLAQLTLMSFALQALALLSPFFIQLVVDEAVVRLDQDLLTLLSVCFLCVVMFQAGISWLRSYAVTHMANLLTFQMQGNLLRHLLRLPINYFNKRHVGDIASRFSSMSAIQNVLTTGLVEGIVDGVMLAFTLLAIMIYQHVLASLVVAILLAYCAVRIAWFHALKTVSGESVVATAAASTQFIETVRAITTIKLFGLELERSNQWQNRQSEVTNTSVRIGRLSLTFSTAHQMLFGMGHILVIYAGARLIFGGHFSVGMLMAFLAYQNLFLESGTRLVDQLISYRLLDLQLGRIADIALTAPEEAMGPAGGAANHPKADLQLREICFRYARSDPFLLRGLELHVSEGQCVAIIGPSGSGKSTLLRVATGLQRPENGAVIFGGVDITKLGLSNYRRMIGAVTQEDQLLSGSIAANLTLFDAKPDLRWMIQCAKLCGIHEPIMAMPMNYHSFVGDMGDVLSAGERQRLMLARSLYRRPKILFLDEATSNLDSTLDEHINRLLARLRITRIIVTHRQTPLRYADRTYRLNGGRLESIQENPKLAVAH